MRPKLMIAVLSLWPTLLHSQELTRRLDSLVQASIVDLHLAGVSVMVVQGSDTVVAQSAGYSDLENGVRTGLSTVYRIGSITKQFTAAAILQQVDRGSIHLDDKIGKYLPECSRYCSEVTLR